MILASAIGSLLEVQWLATAGADDLHRWPLDTDEPAVGVTFDLAGAEAV
jgi:hypothetical protein